jgi:hypothetical protein
MPSHPADEPRAASEDAGSSNFDLLIIVIIEAGFQT